MALVELTLFEDGKSEVGLAAMRLAGIGGKLEKMQKKVEAELSVTRMYADDLTRGSICRRQSLLMSKTRKASVSDISEFSLRIAHRCRVPIVRPIAHAEDRH